MSTYASVVNSGSKIRVAHGPTLDVPKTTNLLILPKEGREGLTNSRETREVLQRALKPSEYNLKVKKISSVRNNGVRIEAHSVDLEKMEDSSILDSVGLKIVREAKTNPRMLIQVVPDGMSKRNLDRNSWL